MLNAVFLRRCEQLLTLSASDDEVDLLDLAGVLRQLALDKHCLIDAVNTNRIKLRFRCPPTEGVNTPANIIAPSFSLLNFRVPDSHAKFVPLQDYLAHKPVTIDGQPVSIRDVIRCASHVLGGIHYDGKPDAEYANALRMWNQLSIGGLSSGSIILKETASALSEGLKPLYDAVSRRAPVAHDGIAQPEGTVMSVFTGPKGWLGSEGHRDFPMVKIGGVSLLVRKAESVISVKAEIRQSQFSFSFPFQNDRAEELNGVILSVAWAIAGDVVLFCGDKRVGEAPFTSGTTP